MNQADLFYESYFDALRDDVKALGGSKVVGPLFWPEKSVHVAANTLNDKLNPERRERLTEEQERLIMRRAGATRGFSAALAYICDETRFERSKPIEPQDEVAKLQREYIAAVKQLAAIAPKLDAAQVRLQAVNA